MKISMLYIKKLYNLYTYTIDFAQKTDNICILTGVNGYGKTTVLKIIDSLSKLDLFYFYTFPFEEIEIVFNNSDNLKIVRRFSHLDEANDFQEHYPASVDFIYKNNKGEVVTTFNLSVQDIYKLISSPIRRMIDFSFMDLDSITYIRAYIKQHDEIYEKLAISQNQGQFLSLLREIKTLFVPAQRLYYTTKTDVFSYIYRNKKPDRKNSSSIDKMISDFKEELQKRRLAYLLETQKHDNQFIHKLVSSVSEGYSKDSYCRKAENLNKRLVELCSFGLIEKTSTIAYDENKKGILSVYIDDLSEKLDSYNDLIGKLRVFSDIIKKKEFANKKITFSPDYGMIITSLDGNSINPNDLSSGEQNELIMLYRFIFEIDRNSILLIDEPELSLHVSWQMDFLDDIESILKEKNIQVIIATHSPQIINGRWNNCFDFYKNNGN